MKAFWRSDAKQRQYRSVSMVASSWHSEEDDDIDDVISLHELDKDEAVEQPLLPKENGKKRAFHRVNLKPSHQQMVLSIYRMKTCLLVCVQLFQFLTPRPN